MSVPFFKFVLPPTPLPPSNDKLVVYICNCFFFMDKFICILFLYHWFFSVVMYGYGGWTIKKAVHQGIDAFKL